MDLALLRQQQFDGGEIQDGYAGFIRTDGKLLVDETASSISSEAWQSAMMCGRIHHSPCPGSRCGKLSGTGGHGL
ncbi:MAG: hypothetical protein ACLR1R_10040 [Ruminococcus callidus]